MTELEILPVVKEENAPTDGKRCVVVDRYGQFALRGYIRDGAGFEHTWIRDDMTGVVVGDIVVVDSRPYEAHVLGVVR